MTPPALRPAYRRGWVLAAVTEVLGTADEPMRARDIQESAERLVGEPVGWSSVKDCLTRHIGGELPRFERVARGRYRLAD